MSFTNSEVRQKAKEMYKSNVAIAIVTVIVTALAITAISTLTAGVGTLISGVFSVALASFFLCIARGKKAELNDAVEGYRKFVPAVIYGILSMVYILLWFLLFIIPGIIKSFSYSQAPYLIADGKADGGNDAITKSRKMMDGYKMQLFCLQLSFIPHLLLGILTLGIYLIWAIPYIETANAVFYDKLSENQTEIIIEEAK